MPFFAKIRQLWIITSLIVGVSIVGLVFNVSLGVIPRTVEGIPGIALMPLFHSNVGHLIGNLIPLTILGTFIIIRKKDENLLAVTVFLSIASGSMLYAFGRNAEHIGASALVFAYFGYLASAWYFHGGIWNAIIAGITFFLYWTFIPSILMDALFSARISWDGHLSGLLSGVLLAYLGRKDSNEAKAL